MNWLKDGIVLGQALLAAALIIAGLLFLLNGKNNKPFVFKAGKSGLELSGSNNGLFLLALGAVLLVLCGLSNNQTGKLKLENKRIADRTVDLQRRFDLALKHNLAEVPNIAGLTRDSAAAALRASGLTAGPVSELDLAQAGKLLQQSGYRDMGRGRFVSGKGDTVVLKPGAVLQNVSPGEQVALKAGVPMMVIR
jgi:hypothetical protein